jgi:hypothetical protein
MRTYKMMDEDKNMIDKDYIRGMSYPMTDYYCEEKTGEYGSSMMALRGRAGYFQEPSVWRKGGLGSL